MIRTYAYIRNDYATDAGGVRRCLARAARGRQNQLRIARLPAILAEHDVKGVAAVGILDHLLLPHAAHTQLAENNQQGDSYMKVERIESVNMY